MKSFVWFFFNCFFLESCNPFTILFDFLEFYEIGLVIEVGLFLLLKFIYDLSDDEYENCLMFLDLNLLLGNYDDLVNYDCFVIYL